MTDPLGKRVVVIGAGQAGFRPAPSSAPWAKGPIALVGAEAHRPYQRPRCPRPIFWARWNWTAVLSPGTLFRRRSHRPAPVHDLYRDRPAHAAGPAERWRGTWL